MLAGTETLGWRFGYQIQFCNPCLVVTSQKEKSFIAQGHDHAIWGNVLHPATGLASPWLLEPSRFLSLTHNCSFGCCFSPASLSAWEPLSEAPCLHQRQTAHCPGRCSSPGGGGGEGRAPGAASRGGQSQSGGSSVSEDDIGLGFWNPCCVPGTVRNS